MNVRWVYISELSTLLTVICVYLRRIIVIVYIRLFLSGRHPAEGFLFVVKSDNLLDKSQKHPDFTGDMYPSVDISQMGFNCAGADLHFSGHFLVAKTPANVLCHLQFPRA